MFDTADQEPGGGWLQGGRSMPDRAHEYAACVVWEGNVGEGTSSYASYGRQYRVIVAGKPDLAGTADTAFRGEPGRHNPEELFLAAISACHMLFYLALCARAGVRVLAYEDRAFGRLVVDSSGGGRFDAVTLRPRVAIAGQGQADLAARLHDTAHQRCFVANSCSVPIRLEAGIEDARE